MHRPHAEGGACAAMMGCAGDTESNRQNPVILCRAAEHTEIQVGKDGTPSTDKLQAPGSQAPGMAPETKCSLYKPGACRLRGWVIGGIKPKRHGFSSRAGNSTECSQPGRKPFPLNGNTPLLEGGKGRQSHNLEGGFEKLGELQDS